MEALSQSYSHIAMYSTVRMSQHNTCMYCTHIDDHDIKFYAAICCMSYVSCNTNMQYDICFIKSIIMLS